MKTTLIKLSLVFAGGLLIAGCSTMNAQGYQQAMNSKNPEVRKVAHAIPRYEKLSHESWPAIAYSNPINPGEISKTLPEIRQRLIALGDLSTGYANDHSIRYDQATVNAVKHFQQRHGLRANGVVDQKTIAQLNVLPAVRVKELFASLKRWQQLPAFTNDQYIQVNIPSYRLDLIKDNQPQLSMRVVVGKPTWQTPTLESKITTMVLNPSWNVPNSIVHKEIIPEMAKNPTYVSEKRIKILKSWNKSAKEIHPNTIDWDDYYAEGKRFPYRMTQAPGSHNVLGQVKFLFPNKHDVYLHDTLAKSLFSRNQRDLSHGCVRLQKPFALFEYLIENNTNLTKEEALEKLGEPKQVYISLSKPMPIYITYITSWVDANGIVEFRPDIYQLY